MTQQKTNIIRISDELLRVLLDYRTEHPTFTFHFAVANPVLQKKSGYRRVNGSREVTTSASPPFRIGDTPRRVKTFGFIVEFDPAGSISRNFIQVSFKGISDPGEVAFHRELAETIGATYTGSDEVVAIKNYTDRTQYLVNLQEFLGSTQPVPAGCSTDMG
jgi:hypothetical protein